MKLIIARFCTFVDRYNATALNCNKIYILDVSNFSVFFQSRESSNISRMIIFQLLHFLYFELINSRQVEFGYFN